MADYTLAPPPYQTLLDNAGAPVSNGCVWTYSAGTTTPIATYSDTLGTPNTNPIRTDPAGRFTAYLIAGTGYKFVFETPCSPPSGHGSVLRTADNVQGVPAAPAVTTGTWIPSLGGTATYTAREGTWVRVGALVFARGTLTVGTLGTGSAYLIAGLPFPLAGDALGAIALTVGAGASYTRALVYGLNGGSGVNVVGSAAPGAVDGYLTSFFANGTSAIFTVTYQTAAP